MVLFPKSGLGRFLVGLILFTTLAYLVLNLVSFGGTPWITYTDVPINFGLWRVCDTSVSGGCNQWPNNPYSTNNTNSTFPGGKPGFIRSSEALEIISLIFYIFAAFLIILGIMNLDGLPFNMMFYAAAALLFICIIFLSATLGVMSVQGRNNHSGAFLSWAWWNGLVGLIMTIITFVALIALVMDMEYSVTNKTSGQMTRAPKQQHHAGGPSSPGYATGGGAPPILAAHTFGNQPYNYSHYNQHPQQYQPSWNSYPHEHQQQYYPHEHQQQYYPQSNYPDYNQYPQQQQQHFSNDYYPDPMMAYGGQSPAEQYFNNSSPSPIISALAREYVSQAGDAQYQNQLLDPYRQYLNDPYLINNYL